ncbi:YdbL family protein [Desulfogranum marinum]|uniref:YdbL family protein n=1 Tax=Desulfogranum marinum TaxID=453220 RepID=UPI0029C7FD2D|nr:YdbL family protein [Desulfogranum marinum]
MRGRYSNVWCNYLRVISLIGLFLFALSYTENLFASGEKDRMLARLPLINQLKAEGIVGENNKGYLSFVGNKRVKVDVIKSENSDRRNVYIDIAKKNGINLELVEKRRVLQIVDKAKPGTWLQREDGSWYHK